MREPKLYVAVTRDLHHGADCTYEMNSNQQNNKSFRFSVKTNSKLIFFQMSKLASVKIKAIFFFRSVLSHANPYPLEHSFSKIREGSSAVAACLHIRLPCGVNSVPNKSALIKGALGAEIPAWV